jgi:hypothetical protein
LMNRNGKVEAYKVNLRVESVEASQVTQIGTNCLAS